MRSQERRARGLVGASLGVWLGLSFVAVAACSPRAAPRRGPPALDPGWIDSSVPRGVTSAPAPPRAERWDLGEQLRTLHLTAPRARSEHLGGDLDGEVLASAASGYPLRGPASRAPVGATLVERLSPPAGTEPTVYFVMVKHPPGYDPPGDDWEYLVVTPDGHVEQRGKIALCARCHAEAPQDHLFNGGP